MHIAIVLAMVFSPLQPENRQSVVRPVLRMPHWISCDLWADVFHLGHYVDSPHYGIWNSGSTTITFQEVEHPPQIVIDSVLDTSIRSYCSAERQLPPPDTFPPLDFE